MTDLETTAAPAAPSGIFKYPTFHGKGGEFFKIWIVNVLLTVLTLGIYSAWAKVRTLKYMYGVTELENARFGFHGDPVAILKGRIIASIIGFMYLAGSGISVFISILGVLLVYFLYPFLFVKSLKFRLSNTSYRNLRFAFRGTVSEAYKIWFKYTIPMLIYLLLNAVAVHYLESMKSTPNSTGAKIAAFGVIALLIGVFIYSLVVLPKLYNKAINFLYDSAYYGGNKFSLHSPLSEFKKKVFWPIMIKYLIVIGGFILAIVIMGILFKGFGNTGTEAEKTAAMFKVLGIPFFLFYVALFCFAIYTVYLIKDYVWNRMTLNPSQPTKSKIEYFAYLKISFVNIICTALTFGFFFPWAKMRSKKYLIENRGVQIDDFDGFAAKAEENISALGEEAVDAFDFDIEIGL